MVDLRPSLQGRGLTQNELSKPAMGVLSSPILQPPLRPHASRGPQRTFWQTPLSFPPSLHQAQEPTYTCNRRAPPSH